MDEGPELLTKIDVPSAAKEVTKFVLVATTVYEILKITKEIVKLCIELKKA